MAAKISGRRGSFSNLLVPGGIFEFNNARLENGYLRYDWNRQRQELFVEINGSQVIFQSPAGSMQLEVQSIEDAFLGERDDTQTGSNQIIAPMPGMVAEVLVSEGQKIDAGQDVIVIEAMKLFQTLVAPKEGMVKAIRCQAGDAVESGAILIAVDTPGEIKEAAK